MKFLQSFGFRRRSVLSTFLILLNLTAFNSYGQSASFWQDVNAGVAFMYGSRYSTPAAYRTLQLDINAMRNHLLSAPMEFSASARSKSLVMSLPMPDGSIDDFEIFESPVMAPALAAKYPEIKTYAGTGISDPRAHIRIDVTDFGFHAMILSPRGDVFIDPVSNESTDYYIAYNKRDLPRQYAFDCEVKSESHEDSGIEKKHNSLQYRSSGDQLRIYRLALACTAQYAATKGGTVSGALSGMTTSVNRVTGIYESELGIRLELIENNDTLIYLVDATDPYTNNDGYVMLDQNQSTINSIIGSANYDIGHVFSTGGGGIAGLGVVCINSQKANGVTGLPNPTGDAFDVDYVAHEMGHQFGGNHTFNSTSGACGGGNRAPGTAFEPGSGSSIMAYAGICSPNDLQSHSDPFFHTGSYDEISDYAFEAEGSGCPVLVETGNTPPSADGGSNYSIPYKTYFKLTGTGADADGDSLSYMWEEIDKGPATNMNAPTGNAPAFRSFKADTVPYRYFPKLSSIVTGAVSNGETLPGYARSMKFRFIVRDNRPDGGGYTYDDTPVTLSVINTGAPFKVTYPTTTDTWGIGTTHTVTWDVSSTDAAPINCSSVNILLSIDGGYTYPVALLSNTANDGSEAITLPNDQDLFTTKARIMVQSAGNVFFDISDQNFVIDASTGIAQAVASQPGFTVYPNPSNGILHVTLQVAEAGTLLRLKNVVGTTVMEQQVENAAGQQEVSLDLSKQPDGVYFVELVNDKGSVMRKVVKQ
ncbi:MAG: T9SS type A sorting domain-containing protein [Chitinophagales bacterium]|nr:T9SS type A sorting domain-containing protein [Chitinophagales bacterium]